MKTALGDLSKKIALLTLVLFATSCGSGFGAYKSFYVTDNGVQEIDNNDGAGIGDTVDPKLKFCSPLSFDHVSWNKTMSPQARRSFAIALSITGRFEGRSGWANLTNNFDKQGMSAGLLNQTLGTGSLQPLLWQMLSAYPSEFSSSFSSANNSSITSMLQTWNSTKSLSLNTLSEAEEDEWRPTEKMSTAVNINSATSTSVDWAVSQLYQSNGSFKSDWKQQLQTLLQKPNYVSIQIGAAEKIHNKALTYVNRVGINDLRTYLLMFDIVTQNGSIKESRFLEWEAAVKAEKLTSKTAILKKLVEIRLQDSLEEWREDVRSRKYALIDGAGTVHGEKLNLTTSYCYGSTDLVQ